MQPQQPYSNPYDFIVNPDKPSRKQLVALPGGGNPMLGRFIIVAVGVIVLIIAAVVVASLLSGSGNIPNMTIVAEDQAELVRVATLATQAQSNDVSQQTTMNFAQNSALSIASDQQQLLSFLSSHNTKLSTKTLALKDNPHTDQVLNAAAASSTYDPAFLTAMQGDYTIYVNDIKTAYAKSTNPTEKQLLQKEYKNAQLLEQQLQSAQGQVNSGT